MAAGGHLEFWCSDLPKYKNGVINRLPMPHLVGKLILHRFLCPFDFKFHFQIGRWRSFWILASPKCRRHFRERHGSSFFLNTTKSSNQVSSLTMLSVVTGPPDITQLLVGFMGLFASLSRHLHTHISQNASQMVISHLVSKHIPVYIVREFVGQGWTSRN